MSKRLEYQRLLADGKIVNIGCGEMPVDFGAEAVHVDLDVWNHKNFVQADAHNLPFKDDQFDTAVLGDILEHSPDPAQMLREAGRVAKKVVATIYEEWRLEEYGKSNKDYLEHMYKEIRKMGFDSQFEYLKSLPVHRDRIVSVTPDDPDRPHHPHIQCFTRQSLVKYIEDSGLHINILTRFQEGEHEGRPTYNWLFVGRK